MWHPEAHLGWILLKCRSMWVWGMQPNYSEINFVGAPCWAGSGRYQNQIRHAWVPGHTEEGTTLHCLLSLSVSFDCPHPPRSSPFSGNISQCIVHWSSASESFWCIYEKSGVGWVRGCPRLTKSYSWSEPWDLHFNDYYAHYNLRTPDLGPAWIALVIIQGGTTECLNTASYI